MKHNMKIKRDIAIRILIGLTLVLICCIIGSCISNFESAYPMGGDIVLFEGQEAMVMRCSDLSGPRTYVIRLSDYRMLEVLGSEIRKK